MKEETHLVLWVWVGLGTLTVLYGLVLVLLRSAARGDQYLEQLLSERRHGLRT